MADFEKYYPTLKKHEGGYASADFAASINDAGGETYLGIARNFNQSWEGWKIIDEYKAAHGEPKWNSYISDPRLPELAKQHSKKAYWDFLCLDKFVNQSVAEYLMDFGFNSGLKTVAKAVQKIVGVSVDGSIGSKSLEAINGYDQQKLFDELVAYRVSFLMAITKLKQSVKDALVKRAMSFKFVP